MSYPKTPEEFAKANDDLAAAVVQRNIDTLKQLDKQAEERLAATKLENKKHRRYLTIIVCIQVAAVILQALFSYLGRH